MLYRIDAGKIRTRAVEFAAADHCNLRCSGCSHMSPFLRARLGRGRGTGERDGSLATVMLADEIRVLGGEPLLNPRIVPILRAAKNSGIGKRVVVSTNGLLLHSMPDEFWANVDEVRMNLYPGARPTDRLVVRSRERAAESGTVLDVAEYSAFRTTLVTEPHPRGRHHKLNFRTCMNAHLFHCHLVHAGWFYKCACPAYLDEYLGATNQKGYDRTQDGFDIHGARDLRNELWLFLTDATPWRRVVIAWVTSVERNNITKSPLRRLKNRRPTRFFARLISIREF